MNQRLTIWGALHAGSLVALGCPLLSPADTQQDGAGESELHAPAAEESEFHMHAFRAQDPRESRFFDSRHHHDRYYPPIGSVFGVLPPDYRVIHDPDGDLYFGDGAWYRERSRGRYVVVVPQIGIAVPALPLHYTVVLIGGVPYYYANNTYYLQSPSGFLVVDPADR